MADIGSFNDNTQIARVLAGLKGPAAFFTRPNLAPSMQVVEGYPASIAQKYEMKPVSGTTFDPWVMRRPNSSVK